MLPATLAAITPAEPHGAFVTLRIGPTPVLARVTHDAVATLGLQPGRAVFALVKATAFDHE